MVLLLPPALQRKGSSDSGADHPPRGDKLDHQHALQPTNLRWNDQGKRKYGQNEWLNNISVLIEDLTVTAACPDVLPPRRLCRHRVHLHPRHARQRHGQSHRPHMRSSHDLLHHLNSFLELMFNYGFTEAKKIANEGEI